MMMLLSALLFAGACLAGSDPIVIKGNKFFFSTNGTQFYIRGVAYQPDVTSLNATTSGATSFTDPLADASGCARDIPLLQSLGTNLIRTYAIDTTKDHSQCMQMLQDAGIYVIADLSEPGTSINRNSPSWDLSLYQRYTSVIDTLGNYTNTLGFFAGNEVTSNTTNTAASAFVKAAVRDMKAYISAQGYRPMGIGYATNDDADTRDPLSSYFDCGDTQSRVDFYGVNMYEWCGQSSYQSSGYAQRTQEFSDYTVPVFLSEYGCNQPSPRVFTEVQAIYSSPMDTVWSGGIVYEYFQETNNYGLVSVSNGQASKLPDFTALQSQLASVSPTLVQSASFQPSNTALRSCPPTGTAWSAVASPLPPTPNQQACDCMAQSLSCVASSSLNSTQVGAVFGVLCGLSSAACAGISANGTTGKYGSYSMCSPQQKLSYALNQYYLSQNSAATACDFNGAATVTSAASPSGTCASLNSQAGSAGTGTITGGSTGATRSTAATSSKAAAAAVQGSSYFSVLVIMGLSTLAGMALLV